MAGGRLKIVIVEDDASMRQAIERLLLAADYDVLWYESAEAVGAVEAAMTADCLILDNHLPGMSGFELYRTLTRSGLTTPAIFISAHDERNVAKRSRTTGCGSLPGQALCCTSTPERRRRCDASNLERNSRPANRA